MQSVNIQVVPGEIRQLTPHLFVRKFTLTDGDLGINQREVRQLHYTGWPDHGVPSN